MTPDSTPAPPSLQLRVALRTDVGMRRATNQDSLVAIPTPNGEPIEGDAFLMVADGMGAHAAGELASRLAVESIPHSYLKSASDSAPAALRRAIRDANDTIHSKGQSSADFTGMGTTCSCLVATQGAVLVGHVGDSRVYRLRGGVLEQLTFDHSLVWEMAAASNVTADKVPSYIPKNVITRSLGPHETVIVDLEGPHPIEPGDIYLLCSDGLTGVVDDKLAGGVLQSLEPTEAVDALVNIANLRGGPDNISVIVARAESVDPAAVPAKRSARSTPVWGPAIGMAAICAMACGWFLMQGNESGILASGLGLGASIAYALLARAGGPSMQNAPQRNLSGVFGNGPYRQTDCSVYREAAEELRELTNQLAALSNEQASEEVAFEAISLDWTSFEQPQQLAEEVYNKGDYPAAISAYSRLVGAVMEAIRSDSGTTHNRRAGKG